METGLTRKFVKLAIISPHLKCPICLDVFTSPIRLSCGYYLFISSHTFCRFCLTKYIENSSNCPECRRTIDEKMVGFDRLAAEIINELEVFCPSD